MAWPPRAGVRVAGGRRSARPRCDSAVEFDQHFRRPRERSGCSTRQTTRPRSGKTRTWVSSPRPSRKPTRLARTVTPCPRHPEGAPARGATESGPRAEARQSAPRRARSPGSRSGSNPRRHPRPPRPAASPEPDTRSEHALPRSPVPAWSSRSAPHAPDRPEPEPIPRCTTPEAPGLEKERSIGDSATIGPRRAPSGSRTSGIARRSDAG